MKVIIGVALVEVQHEETVMDDRTADVTGIGTGTGIGILVHLLDLKQYHDPHKNQRENENELLPVQGEDSN